MHQSIALMLRNPQTRATVVRALATRGRNGDTMLAHINPQEAAMLKRAEGVCTINPRTGLRQFYGDDVDAEMKRRGMTPPPDCYPDTGPRLPQIANDDDRRKLPGGAEYLDPNGNIRRTPAPGSPEHVPLAGDLAETFEAPYWQQDDIVRSAESLKSQKPIDPRDDYSFWGAAGPYLKGFSDFTDKFIGEPLHAAFTGVVGFPGDATVALDNISRKLAGAPLEAPDAFHLWPTSTDLQNALFGPPKVADTVEGRAVQNALTLLAGAYLTGSSSRATIPAMTRNAGGLEGEVADGLLGAGEDAGKALTTRSANAYNPDQLPQLPPQRPFAADYSPAGGPQGQPADATGRLTRDIEGRPLTGRWVVGRKVVGGNDEAFPPSQSNALTKAGTGRIAQVAPPGAVGSGWLDPETLGATVVDKNSGLPLAVHIANDLSPEDALIVHAHENGHVIQSIAAPRVGIDTPPALVGDLRRIYNDLNNPNWAYRGVRAWKGGETPPGVVAPETLGYSPDEVADELWTEAIRAYMADPNYIKTVAPDVAAKIREYVNANPTLSKIIQFNAAAPIGAGGAVGAGSLLGRSTSPSQPGGNATQTNSNPAQPNSSSSPAMQHPAINQMLNNPQTRAAIVQGLANRGRGGDSMIVHVNPQEAAMLKRAGGSGTINPQTGLREYGKTVGGGGLGGGGVGGGDGGLGGNGGGGPSGGSGGGQGGAGGAGSLAGIRNQGSGIFGAPQGGPVSDVQGYSGGININPGKIAGSMIGNALAGPLGGILGGLGGGQLTGNVNIGGSAYGIHMGGAPMNSGSGGGLLGGGQPGGTHAGSIGPGGTGLAQSLMAAGMSPATAAMMASPTAGANPTVPAILQQLRGATGGATPAAATTKPAAIPSLVPLVSRTPSGNLIGNAYGQVPAWAMPPYQLGMAPTTFPIPYTA